MIKVYTPLMMINSFHDWFGYNKNHADYNILNFEPTENLQEVLNQDLKIAAIPMDYELYDCENKYKFNPKNFDLCLISDIEQNYPEKIQKWITNLGIKNYLVAYGAPYDNVPPGWIYRPWWCFNILNKNQFQNITYEDPLFDFDILLGAIRNHRNFVMAKLQNSFLLSKSIVTYRSAFSFNYSLSLTGSDSLTKQTVKLLQGRPLLHPYVSSNLDPSWEVRENITNDVSELVPWEIYRHTKYSVVCETNPYNTFITEKIGKVLFAKRIFVLFGSYKYLDTLRKLGFRTFHGIIDETYDTEHSPVMRYNMAFEQLEWLSKQDHKTIIDSTAEICNHNHNHLLKYHQEIKHLMSKAVYNKIQEIKNAKNIQ